MSGEKQTVPVNLKCDEAGVTRMLGAHVDEELYWAFKKAAASRNEPLKSAICHAARIYIDLVERKEV